MSTNRTIPNYFANPKRNKQYDQALREYLRATWKQSGRTYTQIARASGLGDPGKDEAYGKAIMHALQDFAENDADTIVWYPNLRLPEAALQKKIDKSKYNHHAFKLYKHSPYRKIIDRDPSRMTEIVSKVILGYLTANGSKSGHAILEAMKMKLGYIARSVVERCLLALVTKGEVIKEVVNPTLTLHYLP